MQRDLSTINKEYEQSSVDPWGSDWRGSLALWHDFCTEKILEFIQARFDSTTSLAIADIGCGSGILSEKIYKKIREKYHISEYIAGDVSAAAIAKATRIFPDSAIKYTVVSESMSEIPDRKFDVILGFQFLSYLNRKERIALYSIFRTLTKPLSAVILSSNVRTDNNEDHAYLNAAGLQEDLSASFSEVSICDLFTAQYVEKFEAKIYKFSKFPPIRWILQNRTLPSIFHQYYQNRTTDSYPIKRMRMYFCA